MPLTLRAVSLNDLPITQPITASFGPTGGSIGRADTNTLALPDPERRISRRQADIRASGSSFVLENVGSANPIIVRDQSLAQGESAPLQHGDQVRIGGYLLEVAIDDSAPEDRTAVGSAASFPDPFAPLQRAPSPPPLAAAPTQTQRSAAAFPSSSPFADLGGPVSAGNPFAELLGDPVPGARPPSSSGGGSQPAPSRLPDDFDPFAAPAPPKAGPAPPPSMGGGAFDDLIPSTSPASIDSFFDLKPGGSQDPLAAFLAAAPPAGSPPRDAPMSTDPLALFGADAAPRRTPASESLPDQTPELRAAFLPPKPMPPIAAKAAATPALAAPPAVAPAAVAA
ncbi:MAG TPA: FHA domain-containing protein, partial [Caldimonas sp.]